MANLLRKNARRFIHRLGYDVVKRSSSEGLPINLLDILLNLHSSLGAVVIQVGANDGSLEDPVVRLIEKHRLRAIFIEPQSDFCELLQRRYSDHDRFRVERVAIDDCEAERVFYTVPDLNDVLPQWVNGIASFDRNHILKHARQLRLSRASLGKMIRAQKVKVVRLKTVLDKYPDFFNVVLLQVDAEGCDWNIIRSSINDDFLPPIINFEHSHLSLETQRACRSYLSGFGYRFVVSGKDTLCLRGCPDTGCVL